MRKERFVLLGTVLFSVTLALIATVNSQTTYPPSTLFDFYANSTDESGVAKVEIFVDPNPTYTTGLIHTCNFSPAQKIAPCSAADEGPFNIGVHTYVARATDMDGQTSISSSGSFIVNTTTVYANDSTTTVTLNPSELHPGDMTQITIDFAYSGYMANQIVEFDLEILPDGIPWNSANGCMWGEQTIGPFGSGADLTWPAGTVSENGHFNIVFTCTLPLAVSGGDKSLSVTPILP